MPPRSNSELFSPEYCPKKKHISKFNFPHKFPSIETILKKLPLSVQKIAIINVQIRTEKEGQSTIATSNNSASRSLQKPNCVVFGLLIHIIISNE